MIPRGHSQYYLLVEVVALEQHLCHSMDRVAALRETALKREEQEIADQLDELQGLIVVLQRRLTALQPPNPMFMRVPAVQNLTGEEYSPE